MADDKSIVGNRWCFSKRARHANRPPNRLIQDIRLMRQLINSRCMRTDTGPTSGTKPALDRPGGARQPTVNRDTVLMHHCKGSSTGGLNNS